MQILYRITVTGIEYVINMVLLRNKMVIIESVSIVDDFLNFKANVNAQKL